MADIQSQIKEARDNGYSDDEIIGHLGASSGLAPKINEARKQGYSAGEIIGHLSAAPAPEPPGPVNRFLSSAWEMVNPMPIVRGVGEALTGPSAWQRAHSAIAAGREIRKGLPPPPGAEAMPLAESSAQMEPPYPFLAAPAVRAGGQAREGDIAGAAGTLTGAVLGPKLIEKGVGKVAGKVAKPFKTPISESAQAAKELEIPTGIGEYSDTGNRGRRMFERWLANRSSGREPMFQFKQGQNTAANAAAERVAGAISPEATSPLETGTAVRDILSKTDEAAQQSLIDAELQRVGRINAEAQAQQRASDITRSGIQKQAEVSEPLLRRETELANKPIELEAAATPRGVSKFQEDLQRQQSAGREQALADISAIANSVGEVHPPDAAGRAFHAGAQAEAQAFQNEARQRYAQVDALTAPPPLSTATTENLPFPNISPVKNWMAKVAQDLSGGVAPAVTGLKGGDVQKILEMAKQWDKVPNIVSFADGADVLSALKSIGRDYKGLINSRYPGMVRKLTGLMQDEMEKAAAKAGPDALAAYKDANAFYRTGVELYNESAVADLMKKNPEEIARTVWRPGAVTPLRDVQRALTGQPEAWNTIRRRGLEDLIERSTKGGVLNGEKLRSEFAKLGPEMQKALVGEQNWQPFRRSIKDLQTLQIPAELEPPPSSSAKLLPPPELGAGFGPEEKVRIAREQPQTPKPAKIELTAPQQALRTQAAKSPESIAAALVNPGAESMARELRSALASEPEVWNKVRRNAFEELRASASTPGVSGGAPILNGRKMLKNWEDLGPGVQSVLGGAQLPEINKLMKAVSNLDMEKLKTLHTAIYGGFFDQSAIAASMVELFRGEYIGAAAAAAYVLAPEYLAKAITSPKGRQWLTEGLKLKTGTPEAAKWALRGAIYLKAQQPLAPPPQ